MYTNGKCKGRGRGQHSRGRGKGRQIGKGYEDARIGS